jgi:excisionase family DNA binding protein
MALALLPWMTSPMESNVEAVRFLTVKEAAEVLRLNPRTVKAMIRRNELPAFKVGSRWRFRESQLTKWLEGLNEL